MVSENDTTGYPPTAPAGGLKRKASTPSLLAQLAGRLFRRIWPKRPRVPSPTPSSVKRASSPSLGRSPLASFVGPIDEIPKFRSDKERARSHFHTWYKLVKPINEGSFGKVYSAIHRFTGEMVAVKKVNIKQVESELDRTFLEIEALKVLDHPNIGRMYQVFDCGRYILLVLEMCNGDLFDLITHKRRIKEDLAKRLFIQLATAVDYMHSKGFVHRDLKPENVLFDPCGDVKLIDFNLGADISSSHLRSTHCGTIEYAAPELVRSVDEYEGKPVDCWSLGVVLYTMLCGSFPFDEKLKILNACYITPGHLSKDSCDLLRHLLQINPKARMTAQEIIGHKWLASKSARKGLRQLMPPEKTFADTTLDEEVIYFMAPRLKVDAAKLAQTISASAWDGYEFGIYRIIQRKKEGLGDRFDTWKKIWEQAQGTDVETFSKNMSFVTRKCPK